MRAGTRRRLEVLHVSSEVAPFAKTGGLGDVVGALPRALWAVGVSSIVVAPRHRGIDPDRFALARRLAPLDVPLGVRTERVTVLEGRLAGGRVPIYFLDHPLYDRPTAYGDERGEYADNGIRFALLARGALELAHQAGTWPTVVHAHDWHAGLAPLYARRGGVPGRPAPATLFTIHNLAYQGLVAKSLVDELRLGWGVYTPEQAEYYDRFSFMKVGIAFADRITTVSPRYAREIQAPELGCGLDGFLRQHSGRLVGILNGIDVEVWDPARDPFLPAHFDATDTTGKRLCKTALQRVFGLPARPQVPLVGLVARLVEQKGIDLIMQIGDALAKLDVQLVLLGMGDAVYTQGLSALAGRLPGKVSVRIAHDDALAHRIFAGADFCLMPSRFEPCGLNQLYSLRYGTIPIVRATGGLDDSVVDYDARTQTGTGFKFGEYAPAALVGCLKRAIAAYAQKGSFRDLVARAMRCDFSWQASAARYAEVYEQAYSRKNQASVAPASSAWGGVPASGVESSTGGGVMGPSSQ